MMHNDMKKGITIWLTGYSGSGKTTIANSLKKILDGYEIANEILDGDQVRLELCKDLSFSKEDRIENIQRIAFVAKLLTKHGVVVIVSAISPYKEARELARKKIEDFMEVFINCPLETCEKRDVKGFYKKARNGEIINFTGLSAPYEAPTSPDVTCNTETESIEESVDKIFQHLIHGNKRL